MRYSRPLNACASVCRVRYYRCRYSSAIVSGNSTRVQCFELCVYILTYYISFHLVPFSYVLFRDVRSLSCLARLILPSFPRCLLCRSMLRFAVHLLSSGLLHISAGSAGFIPRCFSARRVPSGKISFPPLILSPSSPLLYHVRRVPYGGIANILLSSLNFHFLVNVFGQSDNNTVLCC